MCTYIRVLTRLHVLCILFILLVDLYLILLNFILFLYCTKTNSCTRGNKWLLIEDIDLVLMQNVSLQIKYLQIYSLFGYHKYFEATAFWFLRKLLLEKTFGQGRIFT